MICWVDLHQFDPTVNWVLDSRSDRGRPAQHDWWAPVAQCHIKERGGVSSSIHEVRRRPVSPPKILVATRSLRGTEATGSLPPLRHAAIDLYVSGVPATATTPSVAALERIYIDKPVMDSGSSSTDEGLSSPSLCFLSVLL